MNKLQHQVSPYLLQHQHNPVHWQPWGQEALQQAKDEDKLILVSIGYAACHWCHVMEKECFENQEVADLMNQHFINIKVDREERPDVDMIYMDAIQQMGLSGGWPLNVFLMPSQKPFYGGTYFPKAKWMNILSSVQNAFVEHRAELEASAEGFANAISDHASLFHMMDLDSSPSFIPASLQIIVGNMDPVFGGMNKAPKFPLPSLLKYLESTPQKLAQHTHAYQASDVQLSRMAQGGIFDQLAGGFSRYSVDSEWFAPHFEKMLYDNGQLLEAYAAASQRSKNPLYAEVLVQTIHFLKSELLAKNGLYYASLDADSEGIEGLFYTWSFEEVNELISSLENPDFYRTYSILPNGNWEDARNILFKKEAVLNNTFKDELGLLLAERNTRIRPETDTKQILAWNAYVLSGLVSTSQALFSAEIKQDALTLADAIEKHLLKPDGTCLHQATYSGSPIVGFLDDYAATALAYIHLYLISFDKKHVEIANQIVKKATDLFESKEENFALYHYAQNMDNELIADKVEFTDSVCPSSNSMLCEALLWLGLIESQINCTMRAQQMLETVMSKAQSNPAYFSNWLRIYSQWFENPQAMIKFNHSFVMDQGLLDSLRALNCTLIPVDNLPQDKHFLVCVGNHCLAPVSTWKELQAQWKEII
ncbi:thioredoxin domain-containing protein [Cytophagaceae bacterium 50C-KIRBA]|uniref:Thioredoxin domain-containing protein n=1 Tax=Aquirufa beregesia TaxID=2516556 RepID=A0ABX0EUS0_9BACT|nr:thioredoxin domain-containing protein [Aquirufa beregesia]NGZ43177.1 thioredoxin domain-containing protein [Aquirufa beregesia]